MIEMSFKKITINKTLLTEMNIKKTSINKTPKIELNIKQIMKTKRKRKKKFSIKKNLSTKR